jgi:fucose permease
VPARASLFLLPIIYLGFISLGLPDGTFGVAWPKMRAALGLEVGFAGPLFFFGTLLSATSSFNSGRIIARLRTGPVVFASCLLTGSGLVLTANAQNVWWLIGATIPLALGAGAVDSGLNGYVARHYSGRHMNWLHACWGIGATCGPLIMTAVVDREGGWRTGYMFLGAVQLTLALVFLATLKLWAAVPERPIPSSATGASLEGLPKTTTANSEAGWLSAAIFAVYVAVEGTPGIWAASILVEARGLPLESAGYCTTIFYGSIMAGRVLVGFVVDRWGARRLIAIGVVVALAGAVLFTQANHAVVAGFALVLMGAGFAPVYPCLMHEVPRRFAPAAALIVIGRQSGAAYVGGALAPPVVGWFAQSVSLESVAWWMVGGIVLLVTGIRRLNRIT